MEAVVALIGALLGGVVYKAVEFWLYRSVEREEMATAFDTERKQPILAYNTVEHLTAEDRHWYNRMLAEAGISVRGKGTCECGYMTECAVHCNHDLVECPGEAWEDTAVAYEDIDWNRVRYDYNTAALVIPEEYVPAFKKRFGNPGVGWGAELVRAMERGKGYQLETPTYDTVLK